MLYNWWLGAIVMDFSPEGSRRDVRGIIYFHLFNDKTKSSVVYFIGWDFGRWCEKSWCWGETCPEALKLNKLYDDRTWLWQRLQLQHFTHSLTSSLNLSLLTHLIGCTQSVFQRRFWFEAYFKSFLLEYDKEIPLRKRRYFWCICHGNVKMVL